MKRYQMLMLEWDIESSSSERIASIGGGVAGGAVVGGMRQGIVTGALGAAVGLLVGWKKTKKQIEDLQIELIRCKTDDCKINIQQKINELKDLKLKYAKKLATIGGIGGGTLGAVSGGIKGGMIGSKLVPR